jgi:hypothetical protein
LGLDWVDRSCMGNLRSGDEKSWRFGSHWALAHCRLSGYIVPATPYRPRSLVDSSSEHGIFAVCDFTSDVVIRASAEFFV